MILISSLLFAFVPFPGVKTLSAGVDASAPVLTSLSFSKSSIDTTTTPDVLIVKATLSDASDGLGSFHISFNKPSGGAYSGTPYPSCSPYVFIAGEMVCVMEVPFDQNIESGTWTAYVNYSDGLGNSGSMNSTQLAAAGFPSSVNVTSN